MLLAQREEGGQRLGGPAEGEIGGEAAALGVQPAALGTRHLDTRVREVGEDRTAPERQGVIEQGGGTGRIRCGQRPAALRRETFEAVQIDGVGPGAQPVAAVHRGDLGVPQGAAQPADQCLECTGRVGGRVRTPYVADQQLRGQCPAGSQRESGEQRTQACATEGDGGAVGPSGLGGAENSVMHRAIVVQGGGRKVSPFVFGARGPGGAAADGTVPPGPCAAHPDAVTVMAAPHRPREPAP